MPNGADKNYRRLVMTCAAYRQRYGEWPSQARFHPLILHDLATLLDSGEFVKLAAHLQLRTRDRMSISVGGRGIVDYSDVEHERLDQANLERAELWLDLQLGRRIDAST